MFRKLRVQFIAVVMASVAIVLGVVFTGICVNEYQKSMSEVEHALNTSIDHASDGFATEGPNGMRQHDNRRPRDVVDDFWNSTEDFGGPRIGGGGGDRSIVPVAVYMVMEDQSYSIVTSFTTAQIESDVLNEASAIVNGLGDGIGTIDSLGLHYEKRTTDRAVYVAFADTSSTDSWKSLALTLGVSALGILAVFFVIALLLSNWALRPVKEAWESQRQFVADASHELKTPLTVILANNSILLKHAQDTIASQSQWIESSQIEAENMQGLVNEMLELAQVESRAAVHHEPVDFSDLVDGITLQFESVAFERGCQYNESIEEGIVVNGDATRLGKAVSTLVENGLKYVNEGGAVSITLKRNGKNCLFEITNTGSAISAEDLPHIFDRFYRTDKARTSGAGGYGLGLAIAREIIREHDGGVTCTSTEAEGTTFSVTLPLSA